jgi:hypothetical protein
MSIGPLMLDLEGMKQKRDAPKAGKGVIRLVNDNASASRWPWNKTGCRQPV